MGRKTDARHWTVIGPERYGCCVDGRYGLGNRASADSVRLCDGLKGAGVVARALGKLTAHEPGGETSWRGWTEVIVADLIGGIMGIQI